MTKTPDNISVSAAFDQCRNLESTSKDAMLALHLERAFHQVYDVLDNGVMAGVISESTAESMKKHVFDAAEIVALNLVKK